MPSRLVTPRVPAVPRKVSTSNELAEGKLKYPGMLLKLKTGLGCDVGVAVSRDQRRVTVSVLEEAKALAVAAVKLVT